MLIQDVPKRISFQINVLIHATKAPRLHETGPMSNWYENRNCQHVYIRPVRKSHIF